MANPMLQQLSRQSSNPQVAPQQQNNPLAMIQQFRQFSKSMTPQGAKAQVEQLLQSGKMSQDQFQQLSQMANQLQNFL